MDRTGRVALYSLGVNLLLVGLKAGLAALTGSLALAADAVHSLVDVFGSLVVLAGVLIAERKARSFPYGLYKVENLVSVILALLIFLAAFEVASEALLGEDAIVNSAPVALVGTLVAAGIAYGFSRYERSQAAQTGSPSLSADSRHFHVDVLASGVVFVALLGETVGLPLDRVGAVVIVAFIARAGWGLLVEGMRVLLDASLDAETLAQARQALSDEPGVAEVRWLQGRNSGRYRFLEAEIVVRTGDLEKAHQVSRRAEAALREAVPHVDRVLIHYEPRRVEVRKWAVPLVSTEGVLSSHFGQAPYFALLEVRPSTGEVVGREALVNPYAAVEKQKGLRVAQFLIAQGIDGLVLREGLDGKGPSYALANAGIEVIVTGSEDEAHVVEGIRYATL